LIIISSIFKNDTDVSNRSALSKTELEKYI